MSEPNYSDSGIFKGTEIKNSVSGSTVYIFNTQIVTGNSAYASGTSVYCLYLDGNSSGDKVYIANNTFDLRGGTAMQCVYIDNSDGGQYSYDFNIALGKFSSILPYVVLLSKPDVPFVTFDCNFTLSSFNKFSNVNPYNAPGATTITGDSYESTMATNYANYNNLPTGLAPGTSVSGGFLLNFSLKSYKNEFPKNSSSEYIDLNGLVRSTSEDWFLGAYHKN